MAENQDEASKTEEPTQKKLLDARRKGQVASSQEVKHLFVLFGATIFVFVFAPGLAGSIAQRLGDHVGSAHQLGLDQGIVSDVLRGLVSDLLIMMIVPVLIIIACALAGGLVQNGLLFAPEAVKPKLSKISLLQGLKRLFSSRSLFEFAKGILKLAIVSLVAVTVIWPDLRTLELFAGLPVPVFLERLWWLAVQLLMATVAVMAVIAALDFAFQTYQFTKQQRMTKQEVKDEMKQTDGDPHIKQKRHQIRHERSRQRMIAAVPEADVVVTNPTHYAVAMKYDGESMAAPKVVAKGVDHLALKIRTVAEANQVPVYENPPLARALHSAVKIDQEIPADHYKAVAEVISYVFRLRNHSMRPGERSARLD